MYKECGIIFGVRVRELLLAPEQCQPAETHRLLLPPCSQVFLAVLQPRGQAYPRFQGRM